MVTSPGDARNAGGHCLSIASNSRPPEAGRMKHARKQIRSRAPAQSPAKTFCLLDLPMSCVNGPNCMKQHTSPRSRHPCSRRQMQQISGVPSPCTDAAHRISLGLLVCSPQVLCRRQKLYCGGVGAKAHSCLATHYVSGTRSCVQDEIGSARALVQVAGSFPREEQLRIRGSSIHPAKMTNIKTKCNKDTFSRIRTYELATVQRSWLSTLASPISASFQPDSNLQASKVQQLLPHQISAAGPEHGKVK